MVGSVGRWLGELGFGKYAETFAANDVDFDVLPDLDEADLERLGLSLGHRKRLLRAIADLPAAGDASIGTAEQVASKTALQEHPATDAERRQLTVMFVDLVGSTELSAKLDPEDLREVMRRYQDAVAGAVTRYAGHVAKYLGDGVLAYFGWPQAHEDEAERAVRAGLAAVAAVKGLKWDSALELQARTGIATGQVVIGDLVGEMGRDADAVSGETPNLAARLQGVAGPGEVTVGETTRRLIGDTFELEDLGAQELKGFPQSISAWRVVGLRALESRFEAAHSGRLTTFVGREHEIGLLLSRWEQARQGEGQVVLLSGEAGIGKSRVVAMVCERTADDRHTRLRFQCSPHFTSTALYPFINQLERAAEFTPDDTPDARLCKLEAYLSQASDEVTAALPPIASLLSVATANPLQEMTPRQRKRLILEALTNQLLWRSTQHPVLMIFEDAHWTDPTSLEALEQMIDQVQGAPVLIVITHRPEFTSPWHGHTHITSLALNRLGREQCAAIVGYVTGKGLPHGVLDLIVAKADGVPLFAEELTKTVLESGQLHLAGDGYEMAGPLSSVVVPSSLHDSLMARLDRLAPVKEVAQIGAVIGREFSHDLLTAAAGKTEAALQSALELLVSSGLVFMRGMPPAATYSFKHALIRDAAYESLLRRERQRLHAKIAGVLEGRSDVAANQPELIAHHLSESGQTAKSIEYWMMAARQALSRASYREASSFADQGLRAVQFQAETLKTMAFAVDVRLLKYAAQYPLGKPQSVLEILAEAERIATRMDDRVRLSKVLSVQTYILASDGQVDAAITIGQRNIENITETDGVNVFCNAKLMLGRAFYAAGRYADVIHHAKDVREVTGDDIKRGKRDRVGLLSHTINARAWLVLSHAERGEFEAGLRLGDDGLQLLRNQQGSKHEWLWMENAVGRLHVVKGDFAMAIAGLEPVLAFCENNFPVYFTRLASSLGVAYAAAGDIGTGLKLLHQADDQANAIDFQFGHALVLSQLAEVLLKVGDRAEASEKATRAVELARDAGERGNEGWATCVLGEISAESVEPNDAKAHYSQALEIAEALSMAPLRGRCLKGLRRSTR